MENNTSPPVFTTPIVYDIDCNLTSNYDHSFTTPSRPLTSPPTITYYAPALVDSGSTGIYLPANYKTILTELKIDTTLTVELPDKSTVTSSHSGYLTIPGLPYRRFHAAIFTELRHPLLSVANLVDADLTATFSSTQLLLNEAGSGAVLLRLPRNETLWTIPLTESPPPKLRALNAYAIENKAALCLFWQRVLGNPTKDTMIRAARNGNLNCLQGCTVELINKHYVKTAATAMGHLDRTRANLRSTQPKPPVLTPLPTVLTPLPPPPGLALPKINPTAGAASDQPNIIRHIYRPTQTNYSDGTGNVLHFNFFFLIMYNYDQNFIHAEIVRDHTAATYIAAYNSGLAEFAKRGIKPNHEVMDNILAKEIEDNLNQLEIAIHLVPPHDHRTNKAERAIRTFKNHWIASVAGCSSSMPLGGVKHFLEQILITLNLLRNSRRNPHLSAYADLKGPYDNNAHPLHPLGTRCIILDDPQVRPSFANHGTECYSVGPALKHYRTTKFYNGMTRSIRYSNSAEFLPDVPDIPKWPTLPAQFLTTTTTTTATPTLGHPVYNEPAPDLMEDAIIHQPLPDNTPQLYHQLKAEHEQPQADLPADEPDDIEAPPARFPVRENRNQLPARFLASASPTDQPYLRSPTYRAPPARKQRLLRQAASSLRAAIHQQIIDANIHADIDKLTPNAPCSRKTEGGLPKTEGGGPTLHNSSTMLLALSAAIFTAAIASTSAPINPTRVNQPTTSVDPNKPWDFIGHQLARTASYTKSRKGNHQKIVEDGFVDEMDRLINRTNSITLLRQLPQGAFAPHGNPTVKFKTTKENDIETTTCRVRLTYNGKLSRYEGDRRSTTANMFAVKCLLNSVISDPDSDHCVLDIKDAYLTAALEKAEYMTLALSLFPPSCRKQFGIDHLPEGSLTYWQIDKALYGMPQAGLLFQRELITHLSSNGYHMSKTTECLFVHESNGVSFLLWVDDFLVKFKRKDRAAIDHLISSLRKRYTITVDWTGSSYIGLDIHRDIVANKLTISMEGYIIDMCNELGIAYRKDPRSPIAYAPPTFTHGPQWEEVDDSDPATDKQTKFLQILIGKLLYYTIAVDLTIAVAVNRISSQIAHATTKTIAAAMRLAQHVLHHPNATITFYPSNMQLMCHSDASHDAEPGSRSRIAGIYIFGATDFLGPEVSLRLNGPVGFMCKQAPTVCAGAYESEYAALWGNISFLEIARQTCADMGHPQDPTVIVYDNTVAGGIATQSCKQRRSKMVAKQYNWIQERIAMGDYILEWRRGHYNLSDFLTKAHPVHHFVAMCPFYVSFPNRTAAAA